MITKLGLHWPLQTLTDDTHFNITHSPVIQSAIQTWSPPFKDKLPLFAPNSFKKHPVPKAPIKMYPKTGSAQASQPKKPNLRAWATGPSPWPPMSSWGHEQGQLSTALPSHSLAEPDPHPSLPLAQPQGDTQGWGCPSAPGCLWTGPGCHSLPQATPMEQVWHEHAGWPAASEPCAALPDCCINQHWRADLLPNTIFAVMFGRGIPSWAHGRNISCPASGSQTQCCHHCWPLASDKWCPSRLSAGICSV